MPKFIGLSFWIKWYVISIFRLKELKKYSNMKFHKLDKKRLPIMLQKRLFRIVFSNPEILNLNLTYSIKS
jgi:hypothetical protein